MTINKPKTSKKYHAAISFRIGKKTSKITIHPALMNIMADYIQESIYVDDEQQAKLAAKTAISRYAANWTIECEVLSIGHSAYDLKHTNRQSTFSNFCSNKLMVMLFDKSLMTHYQNNQHGFTRYKCQLPSSALTRNSKKTTLINLHPAISHAFNSLASELNVTCMDIVNYFMWLYSLKFTDNNDNSDNSDNSMKDRSFNYRETVIHCLRKDKFNLQKFKERFEIFDTIRDCYSVGLDL